MPEHMVVAIYLLGLATGLSIANNYWLNRDLKGEAMSKIKLCKDCAHRDRSCANDGSSMRPVVACLCYERKWWKFWAAK